jgi:hypothetical protein
VSYASIDALRESLARPQAKVRTPEYVAKMLHEVPKSKEVDRRRFIVDRCKDKCVLELGASGTLHDEIAVIAKETCSIDREDANRVMGFDLDEVSYVSVPYEAMTSERPELIVCGEVIEHLSNPGWLLTRLRRQWPDVPVIITVPNAFSLAGSHHMEHGVENVNRDHVAWYSYRTLRTLLERAGYEIAEFYWYNGEPYFAEGLIVVTKG